jgi:hypothetical protein
MKKDKREISSKDSDQRVIALESAAEPERRRFGLDWFEYLIAPLVSALAGVWAFGHIGTSIGWDDLFYMSLSQYTTKEAWVLNRYGHVYLQKFFFWLADDALAGAKLYWCFLFFSTCVLVYWCARMLAGKRGYAVGIVAVLLFCSAPIFAQYAGSTDADLTVMFLVMLATFVYLIFFVNRHGGYRHLVIMLLGLMLFWSIKSKETGLCMAVLFLGLGEDKTGKFSIARFIRDIGWVCVGVAAGSVLLMSLDLIFIGDFWFSVRPSSIRGLFKFNTGEYAWHDKGTSWFQFLLISPLLTAFLFYLLVGRMPFGRDRLTKHEGIVWCIPLMFVFFLTAVMIQIRTFAVPSTQRYLLPVIAGICVWAAQFFRLGPMEPDQAEVKSKTESFPLKALIDTVLVVLAFAVVCFLMYKIPDLIKNAGWSSLERFYDTVISPLAVTGLLLYAVVLRRRGRVALFVLSLCLFFIIYFPLKSTLTSLKGRIAAQRSEWRYEPYRVFANELSFDKDVKIVVSKNIYASSNMLGRGFESHCWMFNVFFNGKFDVNQFIDGTWDDILKGNYTYAFLTWKDWKGITEKYNVEQLVKNYALKADEATQVVLLKRR